MTTISHKRRNQGRGLRAVLIGIICVVCAGILVVWRGPLTGVFWTVFTPAFESLQTLTNGSDVERLRTELVETQAQLADRELLVKENENLKSRLGRVPENTSTLLATVLLKPPATPYDTLMLDIGLNDGVALGDRVFASGSVVIGEITEVYRSTSRATLYSAPGESHNAVVFTEGGSVPIVLEGQGAGSFKGQLPQGVEVVPGDSIVFSNLSPELAATVTAVETAPNESFQTVYMQLPINPFLLQYVEVRKPAAT